jgi:hypothetical protein
VSDADNLAKLRLNISGIQRQQPHFLCIYGVGCLNLLSYNLQKTLNIYASDMTNVKKVVIADMKSKRMYFQPLAESCNVTLKENQTITIMGTLISNTSNPYIADMHCVIS